MRKFFVLLFLTLTINAFSQAPTTASSNINFTFIGCNEFTMTFTKGNGNYRVIFVREASAVNDVPENDIYYTDNAIFGIGEQIKNDGLHFCVYRGNGSSVTVKGLKNMTKYYVAIFEYNGSGGVYSYLTSTFPSGNLTTKNIVAGFIKDTARCQQGNTIRYTNKSTSDLTPLTYSWKFADGDSSNLKDPTHSYATPSIKPVILIARAPGCQTSIQLKDTIRPHPEAKFKLDPFLMPQNDTVQCFFGNRFTFKNESKLLDIGDGPSSMRYEWYSDGDSVLFSTGYKADRKFPTPGVKKVKLVVISNRGCRDSTFRVYRVLPRAIDPSKVIFSTKSMCLSNSTFTFTNNSPNSLQPSKWYFREEFNSTDDDSAIGQTVTYKKFNKIGKKYVYLRCYDSGGCLDQLKDSVDLFKNSNVTFTGLKAEYCLNDPNAQLKPTPGKGDFSGTNVNPSDSTFRPISIGTFKVYYVITQGGCKDSATQTTSVVNKPSVSLGNDTVICKDSPLQLNVSPTFITTWLLNSNVVSSQSYLNINQNGTYRVICKEGNCSDTDDIVIRSLSTPTLITSKDTTLCGGSFLKFNLKVEDGTVVWNDGNTQRDRELNTTGFYKVYFSNKCGKVSDSLNLTVEETACIIFFPNAFTPNADVLNDTWQPYGKYEFIKMNIFNRWGEHVYTSDKSPIWDGYDKKNRCLAGVYSCVFEYLIQDGNTMKKVTQGVVIHLVL